MTPALEAWATRHGRDIADRHPTLRKPQDPATFLNAELKHSGPLLGGVLRPEVEAAFWARLAEIEEPRS